MIRLLSSPKHLVLFVDAITAISLVSGLALLPVQAADPVTVVAGSLPTGRASASAVWDGTNAYAFGGFDSDFTRSDQVVRYNPANDLADVMVGKLPFGADRTSAVWDGSNTYIFGGRSVAGPLDLVLRYDPVSDTVDIMAATLPSQREDTSATWDGANAYIFGGRECIVRSLIDEIVRYTPGPAGGAVAVMAATLPTPRSLTSAVQVGADIYIFDGLDATGFLDEIVRYSPATDTVTVMQNTLLNHFGNMGVVSDGTHAYLFGGTGRRNEIVQYTPASDRIMIMQAVLPSGRQDSSAIWDGTNAYIFGGRASARLDEIVRYDPSLDTALVPDRDGDGLNDEEEAALGTDPLWHDTDDDGAWDGDEVSGGTDPLAGDEDGNGIPDGFEDPDGDEVPNAIERYNGLDPNDPETTDGIPDELADRDGGGMVPFDEWISRADPLTPEPNSLELWVLNTTAADDVAGQLLCSFDLGQSF